MADVTLAPIRRLLVANRGEIARRIIRTAHEMGIATVAVYADGDATAPFVHEADSAIALAGTTSAETYLDIDKIVAACARSGADAVHPGYGFLAENPAFADAVTDAGIRWVGPSSAAIAAMGDKLSAKRLMQEVDVPTLPALELGADADIAAAAREIGYPVLVKAAAGGGGRGMRVVGKEDELAEAVDGARREAGAAFGDDTLFLERWLTSSRHVEIQILGDLHGNLVHLFERECSIQRRHQKIIEEAPSPAVDGELRARMGEAALAAARKLGYASAGTVEFLLDGQDFWFLEVNTRLQVEHPVTEEITGLDLVREQLRIAEGEALGYGQDDLAIDGHAIEARIYAEDPDNDFLPAPGRVIAWQPDLATGARFDSGIEPGSEIAGQFDPMIAKVIVKAPSRPEAARRLARVLENTRLQGVTNNRDFLVAALRSPEFIQGDTTTDFIERVQPDRKREVGGEELHQAAIAVAIHAQARRRAAARVLGSIASGWRNSVMPPETTRFRRGDGEITVAYRAQRDGSFDVSVDDSRYTVTAFASEAGDTDLEIDGRRVGLSVLGAGDRWLVHGPGGDVELQELPRFPRGGQAEVSGGLVAPMPGNVTATHVAEGDTVEPGQLLLILEAMKMEHRITAPIGGTVTQLRVSVGDQVDNGELLVVVEEDE
ncbi:MAG: biotin carboxylase N-terminal domain-containing protein [Alphaproteobacteria bacterium]|jgi:propionyl-CoA carboxylase alpha chain|nr:biotin carboxylase N-terminal domain-containing protein [Alphaproteobacteria bacterium]